jgi:hypothetical protein
VRNARMRPGFRGMGQNIDPNQELFLEKRRDFYVYAAQAANLAASGQATDTIQIEADSNFILQKLTYLAFDGDLAPDLAVATTILLTGGLTAQQRIIPRVGLQIIDTGSGRQLMQEPIPIPSIFGTGELPFILPNPRLFMRNSTIQLTFTNFDAVNTYDIYLAFIGYKVYGTA